MACFFAVHGSVLSLASNASSSHSSVSVSSPLAQVAKVQNSMNWWKLYLCVKVCWSMFAPQSTSEMQLLLVSFSPYCLSNILTFIPPASEGWRKNSRRSKFFCPPPSFPLCLFCPSIHHVHAGSFREDKSFTTRTTFLLMFALSLFTSVKVQNLFSFFIS